MSAQVTLALSWIKFKLIVTQLDGRRTRGLRHSTQPNTHRHRHGYIVCRCSMWRSVLCVCILSFSTRAFRMCCICDQHTHTAHTNTMNWKIEDNNIRNSNDGAYIQTHTQPSEHASKQCNSMMGPNGNDRNWDWRVCVKDIERLAMTAAHRARVRCKANGVRDRSVFEKYHFLLRMPGVFCLASKTIIYHILCTHCTQLLLWPSMCVRIVMGECLPACCRRIRHTELHTHVTYIDMHISYYSICLWAGWMTLTESSLFKYLSIFVIASDMNWMCTY